MTTHPSHFHYHSSLHRKINPLSVIPSTHLTPKHLVPLQPPTYLPTLLAPSLHLLASITETAQAEMAAKLMDICKNPHTSSYPWKEGGGCGLPSSIVLSIPPHVYLYSHLTHQLLTHHWTHHYPLLTSSTISYARKILPPKHLKLKFISKALALSSNSMTKSTYLFLVDKTSSISIKQEHTHAQQSNS